MTVFTDEDNTNIPEFTSRNVTDKCDTLRVTIEQTSKCISEIKPSKAQGPDNIHPKVIKECKEQLSAPLTQIFNKSLHESKLPDIWKTANVTSIYKASKRTLAENYRPISITPICCRLLEKIIRNKLVQHLADNKLISIFQHGFRQGYSCITQLLESIEDWTESIDNGKDVDIIYLDFKAAFDKVPHQRLLKKLKGYGIEGEIYGWIKDFLYDRNQSVIINGSKSRLQRVTSGVPQGSVLGPTLFLIFINDLPDAMTCTLRLFADDTKMYSAVADNNHETLLQGNITKACDWANDWQMIFNVKKM